MQGLHTGGRCFGYRIVDASNGRKQYEINPLAEVKPFDLGAELEELHAFAEKRIQDVASLLAGMKPNAKFEMSKNVGVIWMVPSKKADGARRQMENVSTLASGIGIFWEAASGRSYLSCAMQSNC
jgi:hypothetical protein